MIPGFTKQGVNLGDVLLYVALALKHLRLIILLFCLALTAGLLYYACARPVYMVQSVIRYTTMERPLDAEKVFRDSSERELIAQLTAQHIVERTAKRLGLGNTRNLYSKHLKVAPRARFGADRNIIVQIFAYNPDILQIWTPTMLEEFLAYRDENRAETRAKIMKAYTEEMKEITQRMEASLKSRFQFQNDKQRMDILLRLDELKELPRQITITAERLTVLERIKITLEDQKLDSIQKLSLLSTIDKDSSVRVGDVVPSGNGSPTVVVVPDMMSSGSKRNWEDLMKERTRISDVVAELGKKYLPANPKMSDWVKKLAEADKALDGELLVARTRYNLEYASLLKKKAELQNRLPDYERAQIANENYLQELSLTEAGKLGFGAIYAEMAKKISMLDFGADKERASFRFQQHTEIRDRVPVSPNRPKLVLYSLLAGLLLSIGVPFLIEFLDHTVTDVEDVEHTYRARALGIVPKLEAKQLSGYPTISGGDRHLIENFRVIRTNLLSAGAGTKNPQVILVASAMPEEGKTVVSVNLALSFAQMGEKTLLVDGDLRRGRIHRIFDFRSSPGLSNVLMEKLPWREACRTTENEFLLMMPCGKHLEGVTEMVGTPAFEELVSEWRKSFQRIIIDTPPVLGLSESVMMQRLIDGVVFVIWSGRTPGRYVQSAIDLLRSNHSNIYGVVLNRLDLSGVSNYYNYYNYYYYSYNYYYSYKDQPKKLEKV